MKRTREEHIKLTEKAKHHHHSHKPTRSDIGIHKTKHHLEEEIKEHERQRDESGRIQG